MKPQTTDPSENHSNNSRNGGSVDFSGQESYDVAQPDTQESEAAEARDIPVKLTKSHNSINGSGGTRKTFSSARVKGSNP